MFPAWYLGKHPDHKVLEASHTASLAQDFGREVRNLVPPDHHRKIFQAYPPPATPKPPAAGPPPRAAFTLPSVLQARSPAVARICSSSTIRTRHKMFWKTARPPSSAAGSGICRARGK